MLHITAHGNLGKDPELTFHHDGREKARFTMAARTGKDEVTWMNCTVWGKQAHTIADYLTKGSRVTIAGKARIAKYEKDGEQRQSFEVTVSDFALPPKDTSNPPQQNSQNKFDSDIPF